MKTQKCELWIGTQTTFFKLAAFESMADCKRYIAECGEWLSCYKEIRRI